jgi:hypothetical protein
MFLAYSARASFVMRKAPRSSRGLFAPSSPSGQIVQKMIR